MEREGKTKLLLLGHGGHGKDTVAEVLRDLHGLKFCSSSMYAADKIILPVLGKTHSYRSAQHCFEDRHNISCVRCQQPDGTTFVSHRKQWYDLISAFNTPKRSRLAQEIMETNDVYVGMRRREEVDASRHLFTHVLWVDASKRCPPEHDESCTVTPNDADIVIDNNSSHAELVHNIQKLVPQLFRIK
jgi:hypothetical protein